MLRNPHTHQPLGELHPPLSEVEATVEAERCLYCYDAPCIHACPTHIDIPSFIKKIATGNVKGSARTILEANLLGATCARVCPVEELCEGACVLTDEHKPIQIGRLQRYATDHVYEHGIDVFHVETARKGRIAVIGAGPAGLSCAGELAKLGYGVTIFEKRELPGGLSTYGIIGLREPVSIALAEVDMIKRLGVNVQLEMELGRNLSIEGLRTQYDAVFLSVGLGVVPQAGIPGETLALDGLTWIEQSKLEPEKLHVGKHVAVIGAGNTAVDAATIAKRLGAERVVMIYRRSEDEMTAYDHEYAFAKLEGIEYRFLTQPIEIIIENEQVRGLRCLRMRLGTPDASGRPRPEPIAGSEHIIEVDQVIKAIGQEKPALAQLLGLETTRGYIAVDEQFETSVRGIYAGGDCIRRTGSASTVMAVQDGKLAARAIHQAFETKTEHKHG